MVRVAEATFTVTHFHSCFSVVFSTVSRATFTISIPVTQEERKATKDQTREPPIHLPTTTVAAQRSKVSH